MTVLSQADLDRANIRVAWSMASKMTSEQYDELCRVTVDSWKQRDGDDPILVRREVCHG